MRQSKASLVESLKQLNQRLAELYQESQPKVKKEIRDPNFPKQDEFIDDPASLKVAFCTRRAGKSYSCAMLLADAAERTPGSSVLYLAKTRDTAKRILWKDCLTPVNQRYGLNMKGHLVELSMTHPNGSVIYLSGADANPDELEKLLGQKYSRVVIDEAQSWKQDLKDLVYNKLKPAVADYRGQIILAGTPSNKRSGLFYEITRGLIPGWKVCQWSAYDNPYIKEKWALEIQELKEANPNIESDPGFRQNYLGEWTIETDALVYQYNQERNYQSELPQKHRQDRSHYVFGIDLGYSPDPSAIVVCEYRSYDRNLYILEAHKWTELTLTDLAERIRALETRFPHARMVVDAANKQAVEEMRQRHALPLEAAEKHGKQGFIALMNADFVSGTIKCLPKAKPLIDEYEQLTWEEGKLGRARQEDPSLPNHCADAALYAWRWAYNYAWSQAPERIDPTSEQAVDKFWESESNKHKTKRNQWGTDGDFDEI